MKTIKWTISILIIIFCFIVTLGTLKSIRAHKDLWTLSFGDHAVTSQFFESTTPEISCNIDSKAFTYIKIKSIIFSYSYSP